MSYETCFVDPRVGSSRDYKSDAKEVIHMEFKTSYLNYTGADVAVAMRNGLKYTIPSETLLGSQELIIRIEVYCTHKVKENIINQLNAVNEFSSPELLTLKNLVNRYPPSPSNRYWNFCFEYPVLKSELLKHGSIVYLHDCDVVFGLDVNHTALTHPYSKEGIAKSIPKEIEIELEKASYNSSIDVIDNTGQYPFLFLRMGTQINKLNSRKDKTKMNGVYIANSENGIIKHIDFSDDLLTYGLFRTYAEANDLGNDLLQHNMKQQLLQLEHELKEKSINSRQLLAEAEARAAAIKADAQDRINQLTHDHNVKIMQLEENTRLQKLEEQRSKSQMSDHYEERSYRRKDTNEWLKALPSVVVGIGSLFLAFKAFGSN